MGKGRDKRRSAKRRREAASAPGPELDAPVARMSGGPAEEDSPGEGDVGVGAGLRPRPYAGAGSIALPEPESQWEIDDAVARLLEL